MQTPITILALYDIGTVHKMEQLHSGIIHETWKVEAASEYYILQRVSPIFGSTVMEDIDTVLCFLQANGCYTMEIIRTQSRDLLVFDGDRFWRLFSYVSGVVHETASAPSIAYSAGKLLGTYHCILQRLQYKFKHVRSIKHNIPLLFEKYKQTVNKNTDPEVAKLLPTIELLPALDLPKSFRKTINHGDPKISNFIFSQDGTIARTMVDFDDCGDQYNVLYELGGAFRSWCRIKSSNGDVFSLPNFEAGLQGYCDGASDFLQDEEWELLAQAVTLIPLELASRFVRDIFEDSYFDWDRVKYPSRKAHNLDRAQGQVALYHDIVKQEKEIRDIIQKVRKHI